MRKVYVIQLISLLALLVSLPIHAYDFEVGGIYYNIVNNNTVTITKGDVKYSGDVVIPSQIAYNGVTYSVTNISELAFSSCSNMTSIAIPKSVTSFGENAFLGCSSLTAVYITDLEAWCKISFNDSNPLEYAHHLFLNGTEITELIIPKSITRIKSYSFNGCIGLSSVTIPENVTSIGDNAFKDCYNLKSVILEIKDPYSIDETIFSSSGSNKDIYSTAKLIVPTGTKSLYLSMAGWNKFHKIVETGSIDSEFTKDDINYVVTSSNTVEVKSVNNSSKNVTIPKSVSYNGQTYQVTALGERSFDGRDDITYLSIPGSVTSIGKYAFINCGSNINLNIEDLSSWCGVTFGNKYSSPLSCAKAFYLNGSEVKDLSIPNSVESISGYAFYQCKSITSLSIPSNVKTIGSSAFEDCTGLSSISLSNGLTLINGSAFEGCKSLSSITIPSTVSIIVINAFKNCTNLNTITSEIQNPFAIDESVFSTYSTATLYVPQGTTSLYKNTAGWNQFANIIVSNVGGEVGQVFEYGGVYYKIGENNIVSVTSGEDKYAGDIVIPSKVDYNGITYSVTSIENYAFRDCSGIISVHLPNSITYIGRAVFSNCNELTSVTLGDNLTSISDATFYGCSNLKSVNIPNSVTFIGESAFSGTGWWNSQSDGILYLDGWVLGYKGSLVGSVSIAEDTKGIASYAFDGCSDLTSMTIPNGVTTIGKWAFSHCSGLESITIPGSIAYIGEAAFRDCSGLKAVHISNLAAWCNIVYGFDLGTNPLYYAHHLYLNGEEIKDLVIPSGVTSIDFYDFSDCSALTSVTIPNSVTSIGYSAFRGCSSLTSIITEIKNPFEISENVFDSDIYASIALTVPAGTKSLYLNTAGWNKFKNIVEESPDEVNFIINGVIYQGTKSDKSVKVNSVDKSMANLEIPSSITYDGTDYQVTGIDNDAFKGCNLTALVWDVEAALPSNAFNNASIGSNFLLYVKSSSYAPSSVKNVVVNGTASSIQLSDDGGLFYCPQTFKANNITYTHNYSMETGGNGKGWETIALPFDVQRIVHSTRGEIVPFAGYSSGYNQKPFWLASLSASGFKRASSIQAYEPYIIAMPNNSKYKNDYNLAGDVTFSADNVQVAKTPSFSGLFLPAFDKVPQSSTVYALNVTNRNVKYSGSYEPGSCFISGLRDVRPFEAYINDRSTRGAFEISFDDGMTDMDVIILSANEIREVTIYTLSGQQITRIIQRDFDHVWNRLPKGVYIVNGKKWVK